MKLSKKQISEPIKINNNIVEITRCEDCGPGTKLLGSLNKLEKDSLLILVSSLSESSTKEELSFITLFLLNYLLSFFHQGI